jgi:hypothetical protein
MLFTILYSIGALVALLLLIALIIKKEYSLMAEIVIDKPKDEVFNYVIQLKNQMYYNKWMMADPNVKMIYTGADATIGFISSWESKDAGKGEQEIKSITNGAEYRVELRFEKPFKGVSHSTTRITAVSPEQTKVTTVFDTRTDFPMSILIPILKKMLLKDMNINAQNLKRILEAK